MLIFPFSIHILTHLFYFHDEVKIKIYLFLYGNHILMLYLVIVDGEMMGLAFFGLCVGGGPGCAMYGFVSFGFWSVVFVIRVDLGLSLKIFLRLLNWSCMLQGLILILFCLHYLLILPSFFYISHIFTYFFKLFKLAFQLNFYLHLASF